MIIIDTARFARSGAGFRQFFSPGQGIDQRGFSDIGPPGKSDLGSSRFNQLASGKSGGCETENERRGTNRPRAFPPPGAVRISRAGIRGGNNAPGSAGTWYRMFHLSSLFF
jgi:hypothetical protein